VLVLDDPPVREQRRWAPKCTSKQYSVGVFNTKTNVFNTIATTGEAASGESAGLYMGAVAVGNSVYFAPFSQNNVAGGYCQQALDRR